MGAALAYWHQELNQERVIKLSDDMKGSYLGPKFENTEINLTSFSEILKLLAERKIEEHLGLKVKITKKINNSGKLTIEYSNLDQFELLSTLLSKK